MADIFCPKCGSRATVAPLEGVRDKEGRQVYMCYACKIRFTEKTLQKKVKKEVEKREETTTARPKEEKKESKAPKEKKEISVGYLAIVIGEIAFFIVALFYLGIFNLISPLLSILSESLSALGPLGIALSSAGIWGILVIIIIPYIIVAWKKGVEGLIRWLHYTFFSLDLMISIALVFIFVLQATGGQAQAECLWLGMQGKVDVIECFVMGKPEEPEKQGCRDCLYINYKSLRSSHTEGGPYRFTLELQNKDCPIQENPKICGGKVLEDVVVFTGASYGNVYVEGSSYEVGDLLPKEKVPISLEIYGISKDLFKSGFFEVNGTVKYNVRTTGNAEVILYRSWEDLVKGEEASKPTTQAGPVDVSLEFSPTEIALDRRNTFHLTIGFFLKTEGRAHLKDLRLLQYGGENVFLRWCERDFEVIEEEGIREYHIDVSGIQLEKMEGKVLDDVKSIECEFEVSEIEDVSQNLLFSAETSISFFKPFRYYRAIKIK